MPEANLFLMFTQRLNTLGVTYMVSGSAAVIIYGEPRLTHDVDYKSRRISFSSGFFGYPERTALKGSCPVKISQFLRRRRCFPLSTRPSIF
jgi:hypothetical protein